ncbi:MAG: DUF5676 family membrane protein [Gemmatimonadota bacterium]
MYRIRIWAPALGFFLAISFTLCVLGGLLLPGLPILHEGLALFLPGFTWISPASFLLGLVESFAFGVYVAVLFVGLHNFFARRAQVAHT